MKFTDSDGNLIRPWTDIDEHDEALVDRWNSVVKPNDRVYHLGDVVINRKKLDIMKRLNGKKRLVRGNHDIFDTYDYLNHFDHIYGVKAGIDIQKHFNFIMSHVPIHPASLGRWGANVHGHLHANFVKDPVWPDRPDPRYVCVSVEHTNYYPLHIDDLLKRIKQ